MHVHESHCNCKQTFNGRNCAQVLDIQRAIHARLRRFTFEGTEMQLKWSAWCSITMNPGYAGRSELPDNLKVRQDL